MPRTARLDRARLDRARLAELHRRLDAEVDAGLIGAAQSAIAIGGAVVDSRSYGTADESSRFFIFSATKTLTATALLPYLADGSLDLTAPVASYIPEFGANEKSDVTVLQLLTMQGGFPQAVMSRRRWSTRAERRGQFADWTLDHPAGSRTEYHPASAHWVIAELIDTLGTMSYVDAVHERVVSPAGAAPILGEAALEHGPPTPVRAIGSYPDDHAALVTVFGRADLVPVAAITPEGILSMNDPRSWLAAIPGGGGISTAADIALVYQHLLHNHGGALPDDWLTDSLTTIRNVSVSVSDKVPANRTTTGYVAGADGFHLHRWMPAAPRAFGHAGAGGQLCWVDPDSGISFSLLHDTINADPTVEFRRAADVNRLVLAALS